MIVRTYWRLHWMIIKNGTSCWWLVGTWWWFQGSISSWSVVVAECWCARTFQYTFLFASCSPNLSAYGIPPLWTKSWRTRTKTRSQCMLPVKRWMATDAILNWPIWIAFMSSSSVEAKGWIVGLTLNTQTSLPAWYPNDIIGVAAIAMKVERQMIRTT